MLTFSTEILPSPPSARHAAKPHAGIVNPSWNLLMTRFCLLILLALLINPVFAQGEESQTQEPKPSATTADGSISLDDLKSKLGALDKDQLVSECDAWQKIVQAKEAEVVKARDAAKNASGAEADTLNKKLAELLEERGVLVEKMKAVMGSLTAKGGDASSYDLFVSGLPTHITGAAGLWAMAKRWFTSEEGGLKWAKRILAFLGILFIARIVSRIAARITARALSATRGQTSALLREFLVNAVRKVVFFIGFVIALEQLGIDIGPLLAGIGVMGFVVGFALQGTLSNFASGIMILLYRPYDVGDLIKAAGVTGRVAEMNLVSTTIRTMDNQRVIVPNSTIWGDVIVNLDGEDRRRVDMTFGIGYSDDIPKAEQILNDIVKSHPMVLEDPAPVVKLHELADSSVNFTVRPWSTPAQYWDVYWDVTRAVKERFDAEGISIPFPQRDVHVHNTAD